VTKIGAAHLQKSHSPIFVTRSNQFKTQIQRLAAISFFKKQIWALCEIFKKRAVHAMASAHAPANRPTTPAEFSDGAAVLHGSFENTIQGVLLRARAEAVSKTLCQ
jgi:hypothetical protein